MSKATRRWVMVGTLAVAGALAGGVVGYMLVPDVTGVVASLALAGFGLGGIVGTLFAGGWRSPPEAAQETAPQQREPEPDAEPEPEPEPEPPPPAEPEPPPGDGEPGWYPLDDGTRRYWNGTAWTTHVWRERRSKR